MRLPAFFGHKNSVNLLPKDAFESSTFGVVLEWALAFGKWVVILTQLVVMGAFLWRFGLDRKLTDLRKEIAQHFLNKVDLLKYKDNYFYELSGGMKQLVAICRAFAYNPEILLMDEPFSSLDYSTTRKMELELLKVWRETKKTTLFVSHDIDEAILLADKIIILSKRPAIIKEIIKIDLPRPRKLEMLSSKKFFEIRKKILRLFENEKQ